MFLGTMLLQQVLNGILTAGITGFQKMLNVFETMLFDRFYKVFCPPAFHVCGKTFWFPEPCFFDMFYQVFWPPGSRVFEGNFWCSGSCFFNCFIRYSMIT